MRFRPCTVSVIQLPDMLDAKGGKLLFRELESRMNVGRPCVVLNCAKNHMDKYTVHLLLCCLEEAIKRDGDVKLCSLSENALANLRTTRADRLFEMYDTEADAVNSFYHPRTHRVTHQDVAEQIAENAA